jgi:LmbE family N-acetylglucosaminyl deacetylase
MFRFGAARGLLREGCRQIIRWAGASALQHRLQALHARLLSRWLLRKSGQPLIVNRQPAIVFSPHQDDETLGCGGLIALKRDLGAPVKVVFLTDGRGSHDGDTRARPAELVEIRRREALSALAILGVSASDVHFLDHRDGALRSMPFAQRQRLVEQLAQLLNSFSPAEVYVPHRGDRHEDHEAAFELARAALLRSGLGAKLFQYPIWMLWKAPLFCDLRLREIKGACRIDIRPAQDRKRRAIEAYRSQYLPRAFLERFRGPYEIYFKHET